MPAAKQTPLRRLHLPWHAPLNAPGSLPSANLTPVWPGGPAHVAANRLVTVAVQCSAAPSRHGVKNARLDVIVHSHHSHHTTCDLRVQVPFASSPHYHSILPALTKRAVNNSNSSSQHSANLIFLPSSSLLPPTIKSLLLLPCLRRTCGMHLIMASLTHLD